LWRRRIVQRSTSSTDCITASAGLGRTAAGRASRSKAEQFVQPLTGARARERQPRRRTGLSCWPDLCKEHPAKESSMNLSSIVDLAGAAATGILFLLVALSVAQVAILVERAVTFHRSRCSRRRLTLLARALAHGRIEEAASIVDRSTSLTERVLAAGIARVADGAETVDEIVRAELAEQRLGLERRLSFLATLGNNAPFIGLLGTVLGIMHAFAHLSMAGGQVSAEVMSGISEALVATGVGLLVALPAVIAFNWFQRIIRARTVATETLIASLLGHLKSRAASARLVAFETAA
jgi:biopolymer transport protein ExbB/TolQ